MMKFDGNLAWKRASAQVSANRDVLIALAGVFILLPSLAVGLLLPQPTPQAGLTAEQMAQVTGSYYLSTLPYSIPVFLLQALGTMAMLTLFTDRERPTVAQCIRLGALGVITYVIAQVLLGVTMAVVALTLVSLAMASGLKVVVLVVATATSLVALYIWIRTSLAAPVVVVEGVRNPIVALIRSWRLTIGNSGRLVLFYALVFIAFAVVVMIVAMLAGILIALVTSGQPAFVAGEILRSILAAIVSVYLLALLAAVHRQLSGPLDDQIATFN
jgi:hypothetical protein